MNFFTSDLHFGSLDNLKMDDRPFGSCEKFAKYITRTWNKQAKKDDLIWVIGDFIDYHNSNTEGWKKYIGIVKRLKAKVVLVMGNSEERIVKNCFNSDFEKFRDYCLALGYADVLKNTYLDVCGQTFYLTHKPKDHKEGVLNLFGHSHRAMGIYKSFGFNLFCDFNHFRLYDEHNIAHFLHAKQMYWDKDENLKLI